MSNLYEHAKRELDLVETDEYFKECILTAVKAFSAYGHSGGSASVGIPLLNDLLQFKNITPLSNDPNEWNEVGVGVWQNSRCSEAFSNNGGKSYTLLSETAPVYETVKKV